MVRFRFFQIANVILAVFISMGYTACTSQSGPGSQKVYQNNRNIASPASGAVTRSSVLRPTSAVTSSSRSSISRRDVNANRERRVFTPSEIFSKYNSAVFMIYTSDGDKSMQGSGFFISKDGLALSNYHVFKGTTKGYETIKLTNNQEYKVDEIISYDDDLDYILFRVRLEGVGVNYIPVSNTKPMVGEKAYAIGSPRGLKNTFSSGEISQLRDEYLIQISVPIDHGSSGGALINTYGEVIGITTAGFDDSAANLNFAMSIDVIKTNRR